MRISVISPSFNQVQFLPDNLRTVSEQEGVDLEHIIVDPGSTDGSTELARAATHAILINEPDRGQSHGITKGFERCTGDILTWLNSDDFYPSKDTLKKVVAAFEANPAADIVYGGVNFVGTQGEFLRKGFVNKNGPGLLRSFHQQVGIVQPGVFWRRKVFEELGGPAESYNYCMDYELWVRMADAGLKWHYIDEVLAHHRWWDGMKTASGRGDSLIEHFRVVTKYFGYIHWKWLDRYAEFRATNSDGVVNHAKTVDQQSKDAFARSAIETFVTQSMLALLEDSEMPEHRETLDYIRRIAPDLKRVLFTEKDFPDPVYRHSDPLAEQRVAWHIFDTEVPGQSARYKSYRVPNSFTRHFDAAWYEQQMAHSQKRLRELSANRKDTCVIVANGPSLNKSDLDLLEHADVIVSNFATLSDKLQLHATYFTVVNDLVAIQGTTEFNNLKIPRVVPFWLANAINPGEDTIYLPATVVPEFCTSSDGLFSWRSTVSFFNMQLAFALGYQKVVLIGFDHYFIQATELKEGDAINQKKEDPNHFDPRYFQGKTWQAADTGNMEKMYEVAYEAYQKAGRSIVNATEGGKLEVFPRTSLRKALGLEDNKIVIPSRPTEEAPKLLMFDMTAMGDGTATGEVKATLFDVWPRDRILQVARKGKELVLVRRSEDSDAWQQTPASPEEAHKAIAAFGPETLLYRPVPNLPHLHDFAMEFIRSSKLPLATWLMDDWPADLQTHDPAQWAKLGPDLEEVIARSTKCYSICDAMSEAFSMRYGKAFNAFANGIDPSAWPASKAHSGQKLLVRYAGGLAPNMTLDSVLRVARAVESLASAGRDIRFEINTQSWWYEQSGHLFADFAHTKVASEIRSPAQYRNWLNEADTLLIAYNFDSKTLRYVRYSMANKLPECLASQAVLLVHGPSEIATVGSLVDTGAAEVVTKDDDAAVTDALLKLLENPDLRTRIAKSGTERAYKRHNVNDLRHALLNSLASIKTSSLEREVLQKLSATPGSEGLLIKIITARLLLEPEETEILLKHETEITAALRHALQNEAVPQITRRHFNRVSEFVAKTRLG